MFQQHSKLHHLHLQLQIWKPLKNIPEDLDYKNITDEEIIKYGKKTIEPNSLEYNWIKELNGGIFPEDDYNFYELSSELKNKYSRFNTYFEYKPKVDDKINMDEFNFIEGINEICKSKKELLQKLPLKLTVELLPEIDLSILNKWRNLHAEIRKPTKYGGKRIKTKRLTKMQRRGDKSKKIKKRRRTKRRRPTKRRRVATKKRRWVNSLILF